MVNFSINQLTFQDHLVHQRKGANDHSHQSNRIKTIAQVILLISACAATSVLFLMKRHHILIGTVAVASLFAYCVLFRKGKTSELVPKNLRPLDPVLAEMEAFSEKGNGNFGIYITANDLDTKKTMVKIEGRCPSNGIHIGVGIGGSLDIVAHRQSKRAIIADYGANNKKFIDLMCFVLLQNPKQNRKEFVISLINEIKTHSFSFGEDFFDRSLKQRLEDQLHLTTSWLSSNESFDHIKNLFLEGKIVALTIDLTNEDKFDTLSRILKSNQLEVDTIYLCNSSHFIPEDKQELFARSLNHLMHDKTFLIHCPSVLPFKHTLADEMHLPIQELQNSRRQSVTTGSQIKNHLSLYFVRDAENCEDVSFVGPSYGNALP